MGAVKVNANPADLLTCFFQECEKQFRFLETDYNFQYMSGLSERRNGREIIIPFRDQNIDIPFWATTRYEKDNMAFTINYGDQAYSIECFLHIDYIHRLSLNDLLKASRKSEAQAFAAMGAAEPEAISKSVSDLRQIVATFPDIILSPSERLIERALSMRGKLLEQNIRELYQNSLKTICKTAAKAYMNKEYRRVIELLKPHQEELRPSDLKKLQRAEQRLTKSK